jgi:hypothetical protein
MEESLDTSRTISFDDVKVEATILDHGDFLLRRPQSLRYFNKDDHKQKQCL